MTGTEFVGFGGVGVFNQTGGTNTLIQPGSVNDDRDAGVLSICVNYGGTGTYNLSGGSLTAAGVVIDAEVGLGYGDEFDGVGVLDVSGGSLNTGTLEVGRPQLLGSSQAIMTLTGGVVTASDLTVNGQLNDQAGSLTAASATIDLGSMTVDGAANCATITLGYIGTLTVNGVLTSGNTVVVGILPGFSPQGGTLDGAGNGSTTGFVANVLLISGVIQPGNSVSAIGTLTAQSLTASGGTIQSNFAASSGVGRNSELIVQGTASFAGPATFNVSAPTAAAFPVGTYALLTSTGLNAGQPLASGGVAPGFLPTFDLPAIGGEEFLVDYLSQPNNILLDVFARSPNNLIWTGSVSSTWDSQTTANWANGASTPSQFNWGDNVTFNDSNNGSYNLSVAPAGVIAGSVTVNTTNSYTFTGGPISGGGLSIDGGTLVLQNATAWSGSSQISSGALLIQNGASFTNLSNMGSLAVQGVTISATTLNNSGRICLTDPPGGNAFGQLLVGGNFTQSSTGELDIALGGLTAGSQYGLLNITGIATLAGTLDVSLADGFTPVPGDIFDIIDAGSMEPSRPSITQSEMVFSTFPTPPPGFS